MAGLIPQAFIDDLLSRVDIIDVVDKRVTLKKAGKNYSACCPFHNEKTPSFSVQPEKQFYYCFGCGAGGNAIGFVMNYDNIEFPQAVEILAADAGIEVPREENPKAAQRKSENAKLYDLLEQASIFYQQQLRQHEAKGPAVEYLKSRGLSGAVAKQFGLGLAPPGWDNLLSQLGPDVESQKALLKAGMTIEKENKDGKGNQQNDKTTTADRKYYDRFRHRIMFPIRDSRGRTIAFGGRVLGDDKPKYLNSPETPVFHKSAELYGLYENRKVSSKLERFLIVEGYMDVIALAQNGINNAVATLGTATNATHLQRLFRIVPEVVFCFDGDEAGRKAAWRALESTLPLMTDGRQVKFLFLDEGEDPDTLVRKIGQAQFEALVTKAKPLEDFFFDKLSADLDMKSIEGKARLSNLTGPLIKQFPDGIYARLMLDKLAGLLGVDSSSIQDIINPAEKPNQTSQAPNSNRGAASNSSSAYQGGSPQQHSQNNPADYPDNYFDGANSPDSHDYEGSSSYDDSFAAASDDSFTDGYQNNQESSYGNGQENNGFASQPGKNKKGQWGNWKKQDKPPLDKAATIGLNTFRKPASLKAIKLLLQKPEIALAIKADLSPLQSATDEGRKLLLQLVQMMQQNPNTDIYTLMGFCHGTPLGNQLTNQKAENITPSEGIEEEFLQIIDNILSDISKKLKHLEIQTALQNKMMEINQQ